MTAISDTINIFSSVHDLAKRFIHERDSKIRAAIEIDLSKKIIDGQQMLSQILTSVIEKDRLIQSLSERNRELEAHQREQARYELDKLGVYGDFFAYRLRPVAKLSERQNEPPHFLCQPCFDVRQHKSLLVLDVDGLWRCRLCGMTIPGNDAGAIAQRSQLKKPR